VCGVSKIKNDRGIDGRKTKPGMQLTDVKNV